MLGGYERSQTDIPLLNREAGVRAGKHIFHLEYISQVSVPLATPRDFFVCFPLRATLRRSTKASESGWIHLRYPLAHAAGSRADDRLRPTAVV